MKCEDLQLNLSIYLDDILTIEEREVVDGHLRACPLCREKLADFQSLRAGLRLLARPAMPAHALAAIRSRVAQSAEISQPKFALFDSESLQEWARTRLMPYAVGTAASLVFGLTLLWSLLAAAYVPTRSVEMAKYQSPIKSPILVANSNSETFTPGGDFNLNPVDYAAARVSVSGGSPSLNPQGALVALTKSIVRGKMKDEEVVIVADVFGNGLAQIAEVVEPSSDIRAVGELQKALKNDPKYAPFVPASFDGRSETVRVIFKINRVDINTNPKPKSKNK